MVQGQPNPRNGEAKINTLQHTEDEDRRGFSENNPSFREHLAHDYIIVTMSYIFLLFGTFMELYTLKL